MTDQLGTPRMVFDQSGSLTVTDQNGNYVSGMTRHDYLPFGEELYSGAGARTTAQGYSATDNVRQKFTSKERDNETGLDYFGARYFAGIHGRFTSADPLMASARARLPQSWNRYSYCLNDPLSLIDPDGQDVKLLDAKARQNVLNTLPADIRDAVTKAINKDAQLTRGALDKIESKDENFLALRELVNMSQVTEVASAASVDVDGTHVEFSYQSAAEAKKATIDAMVRNGMTPKDAQATADSMPSEPVVLDGITLSPAQSPTNNVRVVLADGTGQTSTEPQEELAAVTGHELYGHALLLQKGKPWGHGDPGAPSRSEFSKIEERSRRNFRSSQPSPQTIKPKE